MARSRRMTRACDAAHDGRLVERDVVRRVVVVRSRGGACATSSTMRGSTVKVRRAAAGRAPTRARPASALDRKPTLPELTPRSGHVHGGQAPRRPQERAVAAQHDQQRRSRRAASDEASCRRLGEVQPSTSCAGTTRRPARGAPRPRGLVGLKAMPMRFMRPTGERRRCRKNSMLPAGPAQGRLDLADGPSRPSARRAAARARRPRARTAGVAHDALGHVRAARLELRLDERHDLAAGHDRGDDRRAAGG